MSEQMKPTGIDWIGDVPESWKLIKLKYFSYLKGRIGWQGLTADEFIDEGPYLITGTDFENGRIQFDRSYHISEERYAQAPEIQLKVGDLLVTKDGTVGKMAYVDQLPDKASLNSHLLLIRPLRNKFDNRFLFWLMGSSVFNGYTNYAQDGTVMASLSQEKIGNFIAFFPTISEQRIIADYLDEQCNKIDGIICDLEAQIDTLQRYKKSLILKTVTKGLNKKAPMKPSGIDWIGDIPQKWKISRVKYHITCLDGRRVPIDASLREPGVFPYWGAGSIADYINDYIFDEEIVLLGEDGAPFFDEYRPVAFLINEKVWVNNHIHVLKGRNGIKNRYLVYYLNSVKYDVYINGSVLNKLTQGNMNEIALVVPSEEEQEVIADYLDARCAKIDTILQDKQAQLETIKQHKKSLIYEYVTGKKRVKEKNNGN